MSLFKVGQAVFASSDRGRIKGYQLIGKSAEFDRNCCRELSRWAATHLDGDHPDRWSLNYFPIGNDYAAVTRTLLGGPEYSRRGGAEVITMMLLMDRDQFESYECNAVAVARTALAMGYLRLPQSRVSAVLPPIGLPCRSIGSADRSTDPVPRSVIERIVDLLYSHDQIAILGEPNPMDFADKVIRRLSLDDRSRTSFTTGLPLATSRPFRIHFVSHDDAETRRTLAAHGVTPFVAYDTAH